MRGQEGPRPRPRVGGLTAEPLHPLVSVQGSIPCTLGSQIFVVGPPRASKPGPQPPRTGFQEHPPPPQQIEQPKMSPEGAQCPWGTVIPRREPGCPPVPQDPQGRSSPVRCLGKCRVWGGAPDSAFLRSSGRHRCFHPPSSAP